MNPLLEIGLLSTVFLVLDGFWIGIVMRSHYFKVVKSIQGELPSFEMIPAMLCYMVLIGGLYYFVSQRVKKFDVMHILSLSVPFGLCVFGTFDFTCAAIFKNWDMFTAIVDLCWGVIVCTASVMAAAYVKHSSKGELTEEPHAGMGVHSS